MDIVKKERRFPKTFKYYIKVLLKIKGRIEGRDVNISIAPGERNNYISDEFANQLVIPESNIGEKLDFWDKKQYEISDLQLNIGDYTFISQFIVQSLWNDDGDIILGSTWMDTLDTFIFNTRKKFLTFSYKKKKITLWDVTMKSSSEDPSSEDLKDISKVILQDSQMSIQQLQDCQKLDQVITEKDEEISRLKNHSKNLIAQIKKLKQEKKSQQEAQEQLNKNEADHEEGLNKSLFEKNEENSRLRELNQKLIEQIKNFKNAKSENLDLKNKVVKPENNEELSRLRNHNRSLLAQIKKLKDGRKSQQQRFDQLANKESSVDKEAITEPVEIKTSSGAKIQTSEKGTNTDLIENSIQKNIDMRIVSSNESQKVSKNECFHNEVQNRRMPYRHPNHRSRRFNPSIYEYHCKQQKMLYIPKNMNMKIVGLYQGNNPLGNQRTSESVQGKHEYPIPQKINLGWINPQMMQQFCSGIQGLYRFVSSVVTATRREDHEKSIRARTINEVFPYALRTKHF